MTDATYPAFEEYQQVTAAFLRTLLQPYHDALASADSMDALTQWVPLVLPESADELNNVITPLDLDQAKLVVLQTLASTLAPQHIEAPTPWDLVKNRNEIAVRLFGDSSETIPVTVVVGPNTFIHELTEELTYGILVGLNNTPGFNLFISDVSFDGTLLDEKYMDDGNWTYFATVNGSDYGFHTEDFIQGVITAAEWTSRNPREMITELYENGPNGEQQALNF